LCWLLEQHNSELEISSGFVLPALLGYTTEN
jgi:hypothetical protein